MAPLRSIVTLLVVSSVAVACGPDSSSTKGPAKVTVHGQVTTILPSVAPGFDCSTAAGRQERLTFRNQANQVVGTVLTTASTVDPTPPLNEGLGTVSCSFVSTYSVRLPRSASYTVQAGKFRPAPTSYGELAARGFVWDLSFAIGS